MSDWLAIGGEHTPDRLKVLIEEAPNYADVETPTDATSATDDAAELERLARLSPVEYGREREKAAKKLGVKLLSLLDAAVEAKRAELGLGKDDGKQGHALDLPPPEPWSEPVDGAELLDATAAAIRRHVVMPEHAARSCASRRAEATAGAKHCRRDAHAVYLYLHVLT